MFWTKLHYHFLYRVGSKKKIKWKKKESIFFQNWFQKWISNFGFKNLSQSFKMNFCSKIVQIQLSFFSTCMDNFFLMMPYNSVSQNFCTMQRVGFISEFQRKDGNPHTSFTSTKRWQSKHANTSFFSHNFEAKIKIADVFFSPISSQRWRFNRARSCFFLTKWLLQDESNNLPQNARS